MSSEKAQKATLLPSTSVPVVAPPKKSRARVVRVLATLFALVVLARFVSYNSDWNTNTLRSWITCGGHGSRAAAGKGSKEPLCPQQDVITPTEHADLAKDLNTLYASSAFRAGAVELLSGAVQIPTESYDGMGDVGSDERWQVFDQFHAYLLTAFPQVHATLELTKVNTYGLVYRWEGTNSSLKPLLLLAHQDVVPVNHGTASEWVHPPYSGHFDGTFIWGRGSVDDKSGLISTFIALESLIKQGYQPQRTIFFASGFDEESSGTFGAQSIGKYLLATYGPDYFAMLVDEGSGHAEVHGARLASPGVGEKGNQDVRVEVTSPGGHSSVPPTHTSIGLLALAIVHLEAHPHTPHFTRTSPLYGMWLCLAEHAPDLTRGLKRALKASVRSDRALKRAEEKVFKSEHGAVVKALVGTTQAVDLIEGGVKVNALPESASAIVNHRISTDSSIDELFDHITDLLSPLAQKYNLNLDAFGQFHPANLNSSTAAAGTLRLSDAWGKGLAPAPITPTAASGGPYALLAGTIRATWTTGVGANSTKPLVVAPGMMSGNTDTRYFWDLTKHIFRYGHLGEEDAYEGVHTVNEALRLDGFVDEIRFFTYLILNADEADL